MFISMKVCGSRSFWGLSINMEILCASSDSLAGSLLDVTFSVKIYHQVLNITATVFIGFKSKSAFKTSGWNILTLDLFLWT